MKKFTVRTGPAPALAALWVAALFGGCGEESPLMEAVEPASERTTIEEAVEPQDPQWGAGEAPFRRITATHYRHALRDIFGPDLVLPSSLEPDTRVAGLFAVGSGIAGLSPVGAEKYFAAATNVAKQIVGIPTLRAEHVSCAEGLNQAVPACIEETVRTLGAHLWRAPVSDADVQTALSLAKEAQDVLTAPLAGVETALVFLLTSPHFIYLPNDGGPNEELSDTALAARLAAFLWDSVPDTTLREAAGLGFTEESLREQVVRMLADERTRRGMRTFFADWWEMDTLESLLKEPETFPHYYPKLGEDAQEETLRLVEHVIFDAPQDIRNLYTTTTTFVNPALAAIYSIPAATVEGFGQVELDGEQERAGILGHVSFLANQAHPTRPSPTLRGVFVREKLLCLSMPPPPANVDTTVPEASLDAPTMRDVLEEHMKEPTCAACHAMTDPIGLGFERFDGIGRYRLLENGVPIDPSGSLDGTDFADARGIGRAVATHNRAVPCLVNMLWMHGTGREIGGTDVPALDELEGAFADADYELLDFLEVMVMHPAFRARAEGTEEEE